MNFTFAEDGEELLQILIDRVASGNAPGMPRTEREERTGAPGSIQIALI